jgi:hypothetical protein
MTEIDQSVLAKQGPVNSDSHREDDAEKDPQGGKTTKSRRDNRRLAVPH